MLLETPSPSSVIVLALSLALFFGWQFTRFRIRTQLSKSSPPTVPYYTPFGFDTLYQAVKVIVSLTMILTNSTTTETLILSF